MHIEQLEYIVEVAKTGSITEASQNLHISPPGLSQSISNLEEELGVKIFKRSRLGAVPTEEGKNIIKNAYEVLIKLQKLKEEAQIHTETVNGELEVAAIPGLMTFLLKALKIFKKDYPNVKIEITEKPSQQILDDIYQNKIDIGLIPFHEDFYNKRKELAFEALLDGKTTAYVSKHSPLAFSGTVTPHELMEHPIAHYNGDYIKWFVDDLSSKYGPLNIFFTSNNADVLKRAIIEGMSIGFAIDVSMKNDPLVLSGELVPVKIINYDRVSISFGWVRSENKHFTNAAKKFLEYLKLEFEKVD